MRNSGFTLIEVLVALVIVVASLTIIAQGFAHGGHASVMADKQTTAVMLAQQKIEELESGEQPLTTGQNGTFDDYDGFRYTVDIQSLATPSGLYQVTVTVFWKDRGETEQSYVLNRYMRTRPTSSSGSGSGTNNP